MKTSDYTPYETYDGKCAYHPVRLVKVYPLDALPTVDQLIEDSTTDEERAEKAKEAAEETAAQEAAATPQPAEPVPTECGTTPATNQ